LPFKYSPSNINKNVDELNPDGDDVDLRKDNN